MKRYLIKKVFKNDNTKNINYFDWYLKKFVENPGRLPLKKLFTKQFNSIEAITKEIINFDFKNYIRQDYFKNYEIIKIEI